MLIGKKIIAALATVVVALALITGCSKNSSPASVTYQLKAKDQLGVSGTVKFTQTSSTVTTVEIDITGADSVSHPAYLLDQSAVEGGTVAITLQAVTGGKSVTQVTALDNGTPVNFSQLTAYDGFVSVQESLGAGLQTTIAVGDIGGNVLTGATKSYNLSTVASYGVSGTVIFSKRTNGNTLAVISVNGTLAGNSYPASINLGSITTVGGGPIAITLNNVDGSTGKSATNIRKLDNGTAITYDGVLAYDGYLQLLQSASSSTVICEGNIGTH